jgi:hypothetical protein
MFFVFCPEKGVFFTNRDLRRPVPVFSRRQADILKSRKACETVISRKNINFGFRILASAYVLAL